MSDMKTTKPEKKPTYHSLAVRLSEAEGKEIDAAAAEDGLGRSDWVRAALRISLRDVSTRQRIRQAAEILAAPIIR